MSQNSSVNHHESKDIIARDISSPAFTRRRQNNPRSSHGHGTHPHQLQTSLTAHVRTGSQDINQSSSVHETASHCGLADASGHIASADTCVPAAGVLSYLSGIGLCGSSVSKAVTGQGIDPKPQNSRVAVSEVQLVHRASCLLTNENCGDYKNEHENVMNNQLFNRYARSEDNAGKISPTHAVNTQHNSSRCPSSIVSKQVSERKSFRPKHENQCDLKSGLHVKLLPKKLELESLLPVSTGVNIASMRTSVAQKRTPQASTSHICSVVTCDKPSESNMLKTKDDVLWKIKQKTTSVQCFTNPHKSTCIVDHSNSYIGSQSELHLKDETMPSSGTRVCQKLCLFEPRLKETRRKSNRIREIQQLLQLEKCKENEQVLHRDHNGAKKLNKQNNLMKEEKPYRQWHRISRVVTAESRFIISHQTYSDVSSGLKKNATLSEHRMQSKARETCTETECPFVKSIVACYEGTYRGIDSCDSKAKYKNSQSKSSSSSSSNYATKMVKSSIENRNYINQLKDAETTRNVSSSRIPTRVMSNVCLHVMDTTVNNTDVDATLNGGSNPNTASLTRRPSARLKHTACEEFCIMPRDGKTPDTDYTDNENINRTTDVGKHPSDFVSKSEGPGSKLSGCKDLVSQTDVHELNVLPHTGINLIVETVNGAHDVHSIAGDDLVSIPHTLNALAVDNKELASISIENKHQRFKMADFKDLSQDSLNVKANSITVSKTSRTTPKICIDSSTMSRAQSKVSTHQLSAIHIPHRIFFTASARSKSLKSFYLAKRQNKRKHLKQTMGEKWRMRDHSADCVIRADTTGCIKPRNSVSRVSQVTGPSMASNRGCMVSDEYLKVTPSLVNVPEIETEQTTSKVGKPTCRISGLVNSASACNNSIVVTVNQRPGRARSRNENHEARTSKYRSSSKAGRYSEKERVRQSVSQQKRSICKIKCSIKRHASGERHYYSSGHLEHQDTHPSLPTSGTRQRVHSDITSKLSQQLKRKRVRVHWSQPGQKYVAVQAAADLEGTSPGKMSSGEGQITTVQQSNETDPTDDTKSGEVYRQPGRIKRRKKRGKVSSSTSAVECPKAAKKFSRAASESQS